MARFGDRGPYVADNVKIIRVEENIIEAKLGKPRSEEARKNIAKALTGRKCSPRMLGKKLRLGMKTSAEIKAKISKSLKVSLALNGSPHLGRIATDQARQNMRIAQQNRRHREKEGRKIDEPVLKVGLSLLEEI